MSSTTGWNGFSTTVGAVGNDQSLNNSSGFNAFPLGYRNGEGLFNAAGRGAEIWCFSDFGSQDQWNRNLNENLDYLVRYSPNEQLGFSVRFVRD